MRAVVLAGGKGTRLHPYTVALPKPLVPVGDLPIIEIMLRQLRHYGFKEVTISLGHMGEIITAVVGDGSKFGLKVDYLRESTPLGTAGPLRLLRDLPEDFLLMNGDVLTSLNYLDFFEAHRGNQAEVTIAAFTKSVKIDLGVLKSKDGVLYDYLEKPTETFDVSMGVYAMKKSVLDLIPEGQYFDFPMLILRMLKEQRTVRSWSFSGEWLDIGRPADYEEAQETFARKKERFLPNG